MTTEPIILKLKDFTKEMFLKDNVSLIDTKSYNEYVKLVEAKTFPLEWYQYWDVKFYLNYPNKKIWADWRMIKNGEPKVWFYINGKNIVTYSLDDIVNKKEIKEKLIEKLNKKYGKFNIKFI